MINYTIYASDGSIVQSGRGTEEWVMDNILDGCSVIVGETSNPSTQCVIDGTITDKLISEWTDMPADSKVYIDGEYVGDMGDIVLTKSNSNDYFQFRVTHPHYITYEGVL